MKLVLGVVDVAYSDPEVPGSVTTGEVADFLESKYHVMEVFYELHANDIAKDVGSAVAERIESILQGNPQESLKNLDVGDIEQKFRQYLDLDEWQKTSGQAIAAAKIGVSQRKKSRKRGVRPAFIDTGLYQKSFKAWLE